MWNWISTHWQLLGSIAGGIVALDSYIMPFIPVKYSGVALIVNKVAGNLQTVAQAQATPTQSPAPKVTP